MKLNILVNLLSFVIFSFQDTQYRPFKFNSNTIYHYLFILHLALSLFRPYNLQKLSTK